MLKTLRELTLCSAVGVPIAVAGLAKLVNPAEFASVLVYTFKFTDTLAMVVAAVLPSVELILGIGIFLRSYRRGIIVGLRMLMIAFLAFHFWSNFAHPSDNACFCYGSLINLSNHAIFALVIMLTSMIFLPMRLFFRDGWASKDVSTNKQTKASKVIISISLAVLLLASFCVRYNRINNEIRSGLVSRTSITLARNRLKSLLDVYSSAASTQKARLFVFLRSPGCDKCISELLFWNASGYSDKAYILAVFPYSANGDESSLLKVFGLKIPLIRLDDDTYHEIVGKYPNFISRIAISAHDNKQLVWTGEGNDIERTDFLHRFDNLIQEVP